MKVVYNGKTNNLIAYKGDYEPIQFYKGNQLIDNISAKPISISGNPAIYKSEYKNNLVKLELKGNTTQQTYEGNNLFDLSRTKYSGNSKLVAKTENEITVAGRDSWNSCNISISNWENLLNKQVTIKCRFKKTSPLLKAGIRLLGFNGVSSIGGTTSIISQQTILSELEGTLTATGTVTKLPDLEQYPNAQYCVAIYSNCGSAVTDENAEGATITYTEIMLSYKDVPYEPYVGGIPSPSPEYPQPIKSSENIDLTLSGVNLWWNSMKAHSQNLSFQYIGSNSIQLTTSQKKAVAVFAWKIPITKTGTFYLSFDYEFENSLDADKRPNEFFVWKDKIGGTIYSLNKIKSSSGTFKTKIVVDNLLDWGQGYIFLGFYVSVITASYDSYRALFKNMQISLSENYLPYEPYIEPVTVNVPSEVTLEDGTIVPLEFNRLTSTVETTYTEAFDYIELDYVHKKVTYNKATRKVILTQANSWSMYSSIANHYQVTLSNVPDNRYSNLVLCNYYAPNRTANTNYSSRNYAVLLADGNRVRFKDKDCLTLEEWLSKVKSFDEGGKPLEVVYAYNKPMEYDLTNTELGQRLLKLKLPRNTVIVTATSDIPVSKLNITYAKWGGDSED